MKFINNHHYFDWCALFENIWRARVKANPKTARAERSLADFHRKQPDVSIKFDRIRRGR